MNGIECGVHCNMNARCGATDDSNAALAQRRAGKNESGRAGRFRIV
jgi:hypothetical protein